MIEPVVKERIDIIAYSLKDAIFTPRDVATLVVTYSMQEAAKFIIETLGDNPDQRYAIALKLFEQAKLLGAI